MSKLIIAVQHLISLIRVSCRESFLMAKKKGMVVGADTSIHPTAMFYQAQNIRIGRQCYIGAYCNIRALHEEIIIGDTCLLGQFVSVIGANHVIDRAEITDREEDHVSKKVVIGNNVWIGAHAVILPGVTIGDGAVVGAGSVVTKDIPAYSVCVGVPANVIRTRVRE